MEIGRNTILIAFAVENLLAFVVAAAVIVHKYRQKGGGE
jgi:hypothetical protein